MDMKEIAALFESLRYEREAEPALLEVYTELLVQQETVRGSVDNWLSLLETLCRLVEGQKYDEKLLKIVVAYVLKRLVQGSDILTDDQM